MQKQLAALFGALVKCCDVLTQHGKLWFGGDGCAPCHDGVALRLACGAVGATVNCIRLLLRLHEPLEAVVRQPDAAKVVLAVCVLDR